MYSASRFGRKTANARLCSGSRVGKQTACCLKALNLGIYIFFYSKRKSSLQKLNPVMQDCQKIYWCQELREAKKIIAPCVFWSPMCTLDWQAVLKYELVVERDFEVYCNVLVVYYCAAYIWTIWCRFDSILISLPVNVRPMYSSRTINLFMWIISLQEKLWFGCCCCNFETVKVLSWMVSNGLILCLNKLHTTASLLKNPTLNKEIKKIEDW